jgi:hypothetical protein
MTTCLALLGDMSVRVLGDPYFFTIHLYHALVGSYPYHPFLENMVGLTRTMKS